jgi:N-acetylglucosamine-6-phosphate deacetylase
VIEALDPVTGDLLTLEFDERIIAIRRRDLPPRADGTDDLPLVAPGLIDLQVNGYGGHDVNAPDVDASTVIAITEALARRGILHWVPTIITGPEEQIIRSLEAVEEARATDRATSRAVPYSHVEGPFLSSKDGARGVHDPVHIRTIDPAEVERWTRAGRVGVVTVSPHFPDSPAAIAQIVSCGIAVAIGHTHADPGQIRAAVDAGAELSTHLGNGISSTLPRHPNPIWEQLHDSRLRCGLIPDGHHLPAATLVSMVRALGTHRTFFVSDAVELAGSAPGRYRTSVGGDVVLDESGRLSYAGTDLLAGAAANLADGLRFAVRSGISLPDALAMATTTPAGIVRDITGRHVGGLRVGMPADLVLLDRGGHIGHVYRAGVELS